MSIAQRTQLAALRAMRDRAEPGKVPEAQQPPTPSGSLIRTREEPATPGDKPQEAATGKPCPLALTLLGK